MKKMEPMRYEALRKLQEDIANEIEEAKKNGKSIPDLIRDYKGLLDDGIITEDEFETKKNYLLGNFPPDQYSAPRITSR